MIDRDAQLARYKRLHSELHRLRLEIKEEETPIVVEHDGWRSRLLDGSMEVIDSLETFICQLEEALERESQDDPMGPPDEEGCPRRWP